VEEGYIMVTGFKAVNEPTPSVVDGIRVSPIGAVETRLVMWRDENSGTPLPPLQINLALLSSLDTYLTRNG
jgi:hypothetical protein